MPMNDISYLDAAAEFYRAAALETQQQLCCTTTPIWRLPGLTVPEAMVEMNYGCGSTVHLQDLDARMTVVYVGVGAGLEALRFAYCTRAQFAVARVTSATPSRR